MAPEHIPISGTVYPHPDAPTDGRVNLVENPSFEVDLAQAFANDTGTVARSTAQAYDGTASCLVTRTAVGNGATDVYDNGSLGTNAYPCVGGETYSFRAMVRPSVTKDFLVQFVYYTSAGAWIDQPSSASQSCAAGVWSPVTFTYTLPSNAAFTLPLLYGLLFDQSDYFYTDAWILTKSAGDVAYFDGDSPGATWLGTAHNSQSQYVGGQLDESYTEWTKGLRPSIYLPLNAEDGVTDQSGHGRDGAGEGGATIGAATDSPISGEGTSTALDGTTDYISTEYTTRRNLITNPNFETALTGWVDARGGSTALVDLSRSGAWSASGNYSCHYEATASANGTFASASVAVAAVEEGVTYSLQAAYNVLSRSTVYSDPGLWPKLVVNWFTSGDVFISQSGAATGADVGKGTATLTATAPATAAKASVYFLATLGAGDTFEAYFDNVSMVAAPAVEPYFDGDTPGCGWVGTEHASESASGAFATGTTRTITGWAYRSNGSDYHGLFSSSGSYGTGVRCYMENSATNAWIVFEAGGGSGVLFSAGVDAGEWFHWAVIFNDVTNALSIYINGALVDSDTVTAPYDEPDGTLHFGILKPNDYYWMPGKMAHVAAFERALTAAEIADMYDYGLNGVPPLLHVRNADRLRIPIPVDQAGETRSGEEIAHLLEAKVATLTAP